MRPAAVVVLCTLVGLAAGAIWTLAQPDRYRAEARVLVRPLNAAVETLAESSVIESNVAQTLHLSSSPDVSASAGDGGVLTISVEAGARERARQIDAEAVVIFTQKVPQRFAGKTATVLDPAHVTEQTSPTPRRNLPITGLAGLVLGIVVASALARKSRPAPAGVAAADPRVERRLQARIDQVGRRERALAQRAGQLAAREQDLERREQALAEQPAEPAPAREPEPEPEAAPEPEAEPEPGPAPPPASLPPAGAWTLNALDALARERTQAGASRAQQEEWSTYLFFLRDHADVDGTLPSSFDQLISDVFGPLPQRDE